MRKGRHIPRSAGGLVVGAACLFAWSSCGHDPYTVGAACEQEEWIPCYTGPAGTENVLPCRPGRRYCRPDGEGFGACEDEVLPAPEVCSPGEDTQLDEDCDGQTNEEGEGCECAPGQEEPCYDGPEGTGGVGTCALGVRACKEGAWTACTGQVFPKQDDCTNLLDEDCDGRACAANVWGLLAGDAADQHVAAVAVGADGALFVAGSFEGTLGLGGAPLQAKGGADAFVAAFAPGGGPLWARSFGSSGQEAATALAVAPDGGVVIAGTFAQALSLGQETLANKGGLDVFVAKLDAASGEPLWAQRIGESGDQQPASVAVTKAGHVLVAGSFDGYLLCTFLTCDPSTGGADVFVWKLDAAGETAALARFGGAKDDRARAVAADEAGNAIVAGDFTASMQVGETILSGAGTQLPQAFVLTLDAAFLSPLSALALGDGAAQYATSVAWADGAVYLAGLNFGTIDWGFATTSASPDTGQIFVAKLAADHDVSWARAYTATSVGFPRIAVGPDGRVALAASFAGTMELGSGPLVAGPGTRALLAQLLPGGAALWAKAFGAGANDQGTAVAVAADGEIAFGGNARSACDFGKGDLYCKGGTDVALARFWP